MDVVKNENFTVGFDKEIQATYLVFHKKASGNIFVDGHIEMLKLFREKKTGKHYTDTSNMGVIAVEAQKRVAEEIIPEMAKASPDKVPHIGILVSFDIFAEYAAKNIARQTSSETHPQFFDTLENLREWLKEQ